MSEHRARAAVFDVVVVLVTFLALGALCGVAWWLLVDPATFTKTSDGGGMGEVQLTRRFDTDGWYAAVAIVVGFASGLGLTWWRSRDPGLTTALVVLGSAVAAVTMAGVGRALGPGDPDRVLAGAPPGTEVPVQLAVTVDTTYLMWPVAVLAGALMVLWSSAQTDEPAQGSEVLGRPGPEAGRGSPPDVAKPGRASG